MAQFAWSACYGTDRLPAVRSPTARRWVSGTHTFSYGLRRARLDQILNDPNYSHWFARAYVGIDDVN